MAKLTFNGTQYTVDHAVKGASYVHGYDAAGRCVVAFDGVTDFSCIYYDGAYMSPEECASETCRTVRYVNGALVCSDGTAVQEVENLRIAGQPRFYTQDTKPTDWQHGDIWLVPKK